MQRKGFKMKLYYGLTNENQLKEIAILVCNCLGHGSNNTAVELLIETCGAETKFGQYEDPTKFAGQGLCQFDKLPFKDVLDRTSRNNKLKIYNTFGVHLDYIQWECLRYNPLLSLIMCRLKYILIREAIPPDIQGRAIYWKKYYNSYHPNAKGTIEHYLEVNGYHTAWQMTNLKQNYLRATKVLNLSI